MSHVNNVTYVRWAESARVNWANNYAVHFDPAHRREWAELSTPKGVGMILRSIKTDYKFVGFFVFLSHVATESGVSGSGSDG